jgi:homogentisate 1,2-dioxygenase
MPIYQQRGRLPRKRHITFKREDGGLYPEELVGNKGFAGASSLLYHLRLPTAVKAVRPFRELHWDAEEQGALRHRHLRSGRLETGPSPVLDRVPLLWNDDVALSLVRPSASEDVLYRNAQGDELVYVSEGEGVLESGFGDLPFRDGDYLVVPRGIVHRYRLADKPARLLVIESAGEVRLPKRYRNEHGQLLEGAPFSERDIRTPGEPRADERTGEFPILVKSGNRLSQVVLAHHPFDVVGWDGYYYPWAFNIHDFEPKVGRVHLPPPVHQTFEGDGWVVCSFCPRPYDFDKQAVPAPYNHQNVMSDEVLYYASAQFMSRKGIEVGSITLHPDGLPHGPQPGRAEESVGKTWTDELAVMLDTFRPLRVSRAAREVEDEGYMTSWLEGPPA